MKLLSSTVPLLIFCLVELSISDRRLLKTLTIIVDSYISLVVLIDWSHVIWHCVVKCTHLKDCCAFLKNYPLYYHVMSFLIPNNLLYFDSCSVWNWDSYICSFWLMLTWYFFLLNPFTFNPQEESLYLKCVSHKQQFLFFDPH